MVKYLGTLFYGISRKHIEVQVRCSLKMYCCTTIKFKLIDRHFCGELLKICTLYCISQYMNGLLSKEVWCVYMVATFHDWSKVGVGTTVWAGVGNKVHTRLPHI